MKKLKYSVAILIGLFIIAACDNEEVNEFTSKDTFLVSVDGKGLVYENDPYFKVPVALGNTTLEGSEVTLTLENVGDVQYGEDYTTEPDGSSGSVTVSVPAGSKELPFKIIPIIEPDEEGDYTVDKQIKIAIEKVTGEGLVLSSKSGSYELTIRDELFNVEVYAYTGFEEPRAGDKNNYTVNTDGTNLVNDTNPNGIIENSVDHVSTGKEMGFDTSYVTGQAGGKDSNLYLGVTNIANDPDGDYNIGSFASGQQAYISSDADGLLEIVFDAVEPNLEFETLRVIFSLYFVEAPWEPNDEFDIIWRTADGDELLKSFRANPDSELMTDQADGLGNVLVDQWYTFFADVANKKTGNLVIQIGTDSGNEIAFIDEIIIGGK